MRCEARGRSLLERGRALPDGGRGRLASIRDVLGASGPGLPAAVLGAGLFLLFPDAAAPLRAQEEDPVQQRIQESQDRLEQIRRERERLRREMEQLNRQVHAIEEEIDNLEQRIGSTASVVAELDAQMQAVEDRIYGTTWDLLRTRDRLSAARVELRERLVDVYKRGPLAPLEVLLGADSFSDLIHRFKYLHLVTLHDRILVDRVSELERRLTEFRRRLEAERRRLARLRGEQTDELTALERLESQREQRLQSYSRRRSQAATRLAQLAREEERLRGLISELELARREAEERTGVVAAPTLSTGDLGNLRWPVEGAIAYGFGPQRTENGTVMREGVGIAASPGTPVRAVSGGDVVFAGSRNLYGPSVIVSHGGGYYSIYLYLQELAVQVGDRVTTGQVIGGVGGVGSPEGPHVEFQIRQPGADGQPRAVDPLEWLRGQP